MSENRDLLFLGCLATGLAIALIVYGGRETIAQAFLKMEADIAEKLRRLRVHTRHLRFWLLAWLGGVVAAFVGLTFVVGSLIFALIAAVFLLAVPWYLLRRLAELYHRKIEDQLADAMVTLANAVRAGLSLAQALEILAAQCPRPINAEFRQIVAEYNLGKPLDRTLIEAKERLKSENFALFAAALLASHEHGGRLNETVERIAGSVLELQRLERKVLSETAQARKSAIYMAFAPLVFLIGFYFMDPENTMLLFTQPLGHLLLGMAIILDVVAYLWARALLRPDI
ncbi:MAG TPA: type II secretion system F family protein [Thermogutta sp.]|nr:type II secretion system F family protein [Thermogutta sp.]